MAQGQTLFDGIDYEAILEAAAAGVLAGLAFESVVRTRRTSTARNRCHHSPDGYHLEPHAVRALERGEEVTIDRFQTRDLTIRGADPLDEDELEEIELEDPHADEGDLDVDHQPSGGLDVGAEADGEGEA